MKKIMRLAAAAAMSALLAFGCLAMTGCGGQSDEEVLQAGITETFDQLKGLDAQKVDELFGENASSLEEVDKVVNQLGISGKEFIVMMMDGFDYDITSIEVDGDVAHVAVACTIKDFSNLTSELQSRAEAWAKKNAAGLTQEKIYAKLGELVKDIMAEAGTTSKDISFDVNKDGKTWMIDEATGYVIGQAMFS